MSRLKKTLAAVVTSALLLGALSAPALAINDVVVPAGTCAADNSSAVGNTPDGSNPGIATSDQVAPPVSDNNPGQGSTGAKGEENSQAPCLAAFLRRPGPDSLYEGLRPYCLPLFTQVFHGPCQATPKP